MVRAIDGRIMASTSDWFKNEKPLNRRFAIYLPGNDRNGEAIDGLDMAIDSTMSMLCDLFGGVTAFPAKGRFRRESGSTQCENIFVLESFCDFQSWNDSSHFLEMWAGTLAALLRQESIACLLDGKMTLVPPLALSNQSLNQTTSETLRELAAQFSGVNSA